jgi:hypothetical protein
MLSLKRSALLLAAAAVIAVGQPALTTIQDVLYSADGSRYNGTMQITWDSFVAGDTSDIATANLTLTIVNGILKVQLVPTTTASAGAQYNVVYNTRGRDQFSQVWAVPPSSVPLRVSAVLVSQGTVVGGGGGSPTGNVTTVTIADVTGLESELAILVQQGVGFAVARAAVINSSGQLDGASGNLSDCVRVDGSSGPCGSGGNGLTPSFSDNEIPGGGINGVNTIFTLANTPSPATSLAVHLNGLTLSLGTDYTLTANTVTFLTASTPQTGDVLDASYRYSNPSNPLGSLTAAEVVCSSAGGSTSGTVLTQLGSCTMPAGLLGAGDRIEVQFQYGHTGTSSGFTGTILFGATTAISRSTVASETAMVGRMTFGISAGGQSWDVQSWGSSLAFAPGVGTSTENTAANLTISFQGLMAGSTSDSVALKNFTVIRYPAQANP